MSGPTNTPVDPLHLIQYLQLNKGEHSRLYDFLRQIHSRVQTLEKSTSSLSSTVSLLSSSVIVNTYSLTGSVANFDTNGADIIRIDANNVYAIRGFLATSNGDQKLLTNISAFNLTLTHQAAASSANNRFICQGGANIILAPQFSASFWYDNIQQRWIVYAE